MKKQRTRSRRRPSRDIRFRPTRGERWAIEQLLATGLYGRTPADAVRRLLDEGIQRRCAPLVLQLEDRA